MRVALWEAIFMLVILKIPVVYLCAVVWWAVRAEPHPPEAALLPAEVPEPPVRPWQRRRPVRRRGRPLRPHGGPVRGYARAGAAARARVAR